MVTQAGNSFTDRQWRNLLMDIEAGQVIPIVGPELILLDQESGSPTLYQYLANELISRLSIDQQSLPPGYGLLDVTALFLQDLRNPAEELHYETRQILEERRWPTPEPLRQLAAISHFNLFVSTTFDSLLEQALQEARLPGAAPLRVLSYSEKHKLEDLPDGNGAAGRTVYHLFGRLNVTFDYGITEEKVLEFAHRLQSRDLRPQNLFDLLRTKNLLTLGCSLPGWLARFFLRASKGDQLFTHGSRGVVADRISRTDLPFVMFLERRQTTIYTQGDGVQFVAELYQRWTERFGRNASLEVSPQPELATRQTFEFKADSVFISYASEDREYALRVKQAFDEAGVDAWLDTVCLESGEDFRRNIETNIENCCCFVALISRHTATLEKRYFRREWNKALTEAEAFPPEYPFIQPILLDDTPLHAPGIPRQFRDRLVRGLDQLPQLIVEAKRRIRERRLQKRQA